MEKETSDIASIRARRRAEVLVSRSVDAVLRAPEDDHAVEALASTAGYTRSHWSRLFASLVGESPAAFVRRIRLEKAAYLLGSSDLPVASVAASCGYVDPAAFARAVKREFGHTPQQIREGGHFREPSRTSISWVPQWHTGDPVRKFSIELRRRAEVRVACREHYGSYSRAGERLAALSSDLLGLGLAEGRRYYTVYWDSVFTHPSSEGMRSHVGFGLGHDEAPPQGFTLLVLPGGRYATLSRAVRRDERNDAWACIASRFQDGLAFDEHDVVPVPWESSLTTLWKRLD